MSDTKKGISRRQFLTGAAMAAAVTALPLVANVPTAAAASPIPTALNPASKPAWWGAGLPSKDLARQAYEIYKGVHAGQSACCEATFWPIIGYLAANGQPGFVDFPKSVFNFGGAGINAWRMQCGATNGGPAALKLAAGAVAGKIIDEYMRWYETALLPTAALRADYDTGTWVPGGQATGWAAAGSTTLLPIPHASNPMNAGHSTLCHASLTAWRAAGGDWEFAHPGAQSDRCGKICYDAVFKQCELINAWMDAGVLPAGAVSGEVATCGETGAAGCHGGSATTKRTDGATFAQAKAECSPCHE